MPLWLLDWAICPETGILTLLLTYKVLRGQAPSYHHPNIFVHFTGKCALAEGSELYGAPCW